MSNTVGVAVNEPMPLLQTSLSWTLLSPMVWAPWMTTENSLMDATLAMFPWWLASRREGNSRLHHPQESALVQGL